MKNQYLYQGWAGNTYSHKCKNTNIDTNTGTNEKDDNVLSRNDVNFFDYDGTLLYAYTWELAKNLTSLPALPEHPGLEVREWNYTLDDIKTQGTDLFLDSDDEQWEYAGNMVIGGTSYRAYTSDGTLDDSQYVSLFTKLPQVGDTILYVELDSDSNSYGDIKESDLVVVDTISFIGKVDVGVCVYTLNGDMITTNDTYIIPRGVTEIEEPSKATFIKVLSIPATITFMPHQINAISVPHLRLPKNIEYGQVYDHYSSYAVTESIWVNGGFLETKIIENIFSSELRIPDTFGTITGNDRFANVFILHVPKTITSIRNFPSSPIVLFNDHVSVPILEESFWYSMGPTVVVPDNLYDEWITATNWANGAEYIIKKSDYYNKTILNYDL